MYIATPSPLEAPQRALNRSRRAFRDRHSAGWPRGAAFSLLPVPSGQARTRRTVSAASGFRSRNGKQGSLTIDRPFAGGTVGGAVPSGFFVGREILADEESLDRSLPPRAMPWASEGERPFGLKRARAESWSGLERPTRSPCTSGPKAWVPSAQPNGLGCDRSKPSFEPQRGAINRLLAISQLVRHACCENGLDMSGWRRWLIRQRQCQISHQVAC
jgi:hypothetical protein